MLESPGFLFTILAFLVVLGPLVFVHEYGHYIVGRWCGVKADTFSIGFGRKILGWTDKRGTEWKIGWLPLGGYVQFAGDRDAVSQPDANWHNMPAEERSHSFPAQPVWKRALIVLAGPVTNFLFAIAIFAAFNMAYGVPTTPPVVGAVEPGSAAEAADLRVGDRIVAINGEAVDNNSDLITTTQRTTGTASVQVQRDDQTLTLQIPVTQVERKMRTSNGTLKSVTVGAIGVTLTRPDPIGPLEYNPLTAIPGTFEFTGHLAKATWDALLSLPSKIDDLWTAVTGGPRGEDTPVSVYGASAMGGEAAERGAWSVFFMLLITINFFLGAFNLVPLLPLDGGHMAIVGYEKCRDTVRRWMGRAEGGPVDYMKLMPLTYAVVIVMGAFMVLTVTADIINPIRLW